MNYDDQFLEEVRAATDLVEALTPYVKLTKKGRNWFGLCPFHNEKTPSFSVNREKGLYYCFGCGAGGNVVTFFMEQEGMTFQQVVEELARRAGIPLPKRRPSPEKDELDRLRAALEEATAYYQQQLKGDAGREAVAYLKGRGITGLTAKTFRLGYAPGGWENLLSHLTEKGFAETVLAKAGLVKKREGGGYYDTFRDRLVFPFMDRRGRVIGFGGRTLGEEDEGPKYLNSPETPLYQKGNVLYGLPQAAESMNREERALLVEGYFDVLSLHQEGAASVVAASGTAFTPRQGQLLKRLVKRVLLLFDADPAGAKAAFRSYAGLSRESLDVSFVPMPVGEDPDTLIRSEGAEAFRARLRHAMNIVPFYMQCLDPPLDQRDVGSRAEAARGLLELLAEDSDNLRRDLNLEQVSAHFGIAEDTLRRELAEIRRQSSPFEGPTEDGKKQAPVGPGRVDSGILRLLLTTPELAGEIVAAVAVEDLEDPRARRLFEQIAERVQGGAHVDLNELLEHSESTERSVLAALLSAEAPFAEGGEAEAAGELIKAVEQRRFKERRRRLKASMEQARLAGDEDTLARLLKEYQEMRSE